MAWVSTDDAASGWDCTENEKGHREFVKQYIMKFDTLADGPAAALVNCPIGRRDPYQIGADYDTYAYCKQRDVQQLEPTVFLVTCVFSTDIEQFRNPTDEDPEIEYGTEEIEVILDKALDVAETEIRNSAGDKFDPPVTDIRTLLRVTVTRNETLATFDPDLIRDYVNTTNDAAWNGYDENKVLLLSITARKTSAYIDLVKTRYWQVQYNFLIEDDETNHDWTKRVLDQGYRKLGVGGVRQSILVKGLPAQSPVPLDGAGHELDPNDDGEYLEFQVKGQQDFSVLNIML